MYSNVHRMRKRSPTFYMPFFFSFAFTPRRRSRRVRPSLVLVLDRIFIYSSLVFSNNHRHNRGRLSLLLLASLPLTFTSGQPALKPRLRCVISTLTSSRDYCIRVTDTLLCCQPCRTTAEACPRNSLVRTVMRVVFLF